MSDQFWQYFFTFLQIVLVAAVGGYFGYKNKRLEVRLAKLERKVDPPDGAKGTP